MTAAPWPELTGRRRVSGSCQISHDQLQPPADHRLSSQELLLDPGFGFSGPPGLLGRSAAVKSRRIRREFTIPFDSAPHLLIVSPGFGGTAQQVEQAATQEVRAALQRAEMEHEPAPISRRPSRAEGSPRTEAEDPSDGEREDLKDIQSERRDN